MGSDSDFIQSPEITQTLPSSDCLLFLTDTDGNGFPTYPSFQGKNKNFPLF